MARSRNDRTASARSKKPSPVDQVLPGARLRDVSTNRGSDEDELFIPELRIFDEGMYTAETRRRAVLATCFMYTVVVIVAMVMSKSISPDTARAVLLAVVSATAGIAALGLRYYFHA